MSDVKPVLFSGPMVRALLDGRKTMTRRVIKPQPPDGHRFVGIYGPGLTAVFEPLSRGDDYTVRLPYMPGDLLWVREKAYYGPNRIAYAADNVPIGGRDRVEGWGPARSSIHMPRRASRITLEVTAVKVERLQEISEEDAEAEGVFRHVAECSLDKVFRGERGPKAIEYFQELWDSLNAERGFGWDQNPWVIALTFVVHQQNVDDFLAQREAA